MPANELTGSARRAFSVPPTARALCAVLLLSAPALAGDWYVDATNGSDANGGTSTADAWRTISHALVATPDAPVGGTQVIHVAPGLYDAALGETFPLLPRDAFQIVGDEGRDVTIVDAGGTGTLMRAWMGQFGGNYTGPLTLVRGLELRNADIVVDVQSVVGTEYLTLEHCRISGGNDVGFAATSGCAHVCGDTSTKLDHVDVVGCGDGVRFFNLNQAASGKPATFEIVDCQVSYNNFHGVYQYDLGGGTNLEMTRARLHLNGGEAFWIAQDDLVVPNCDTRATVTDCLIANNAINGIKAEILKDNIVFSTLRVDVVRSTIADNYFGIEAFYPSFWQPTFVVTLTDSIVYGNFDDVHENAGHPVVTSVSYCDIGDGDFAGSNGNFSADPLFVDPAALDYRLRWASPCIETGDPAIPAGSLDLAGYARPIDGDLDTLERFDVGAYEFAPLFSVSTGQLGTDLLFELWGPQGNATTLYFSRKPLGAPQATPFGELDLQSPFGPFRVTTVGSGPPRVIKRRIPPLQGLVGLTFSFQALTDSSAAPQGKAYTNPFGLTIVP